MTAVCVLQQNRHVVEEAQTEGLHEAEIECVACCDPYRMFVGHHDHAGQAVA